MTTTTIITTLVLLAFLAALGAVVMFVYLAGQVGGAVTGAVMQASAGGTANDDLPPSAEELRLRASAERVDAMVREFDRAMKPHS